jgi:hypothetical protein
MDDPVAHACPTAGQSHPILVINLPPGPGLVPVPTVQDSSSSSLVPDGLKDQCPVPSAQCALTHLQPGQLSSALCCT